MTLRSKSRKQQAVRWLCAAGLALAAHVVVSRLACGSASFDLTDPRYYRIFVPLLAVAAAFAWETRWDGVEREEEGEKGESGEKREKGESGEKVKAQGEGEQRKVSDSIVQLPTTNCQLPTLPRTHSACAKATADRQIPLPGEAEYAQAREMTHQEIPDFEADGEYLELLGKSAAEGYAPALAKLGEYAMRRAAWVEAYYWMKQAQRGGMHGLSPTLREIRKNWSLDGFPGQLSNVNELFTAEAGSIGRALLHVDSGHEAAAAKEFLRANHPEFLP